MNEYEQSYYDALINAPSQYIGAIQYEYNKDKMHIPSYTEFKKSPIHIIPDTMYGEVFLQITHCIILQNVMPGRYYISNFGRVFDMCGMKYLPGSYNSNGYLKVKLTCIESNLKLCFKDVYIHQLVNFFFNYPVFDPYESKSIHKDKDKSNNRADNLEWKSKEELDKPENHLDASCGNNAKIPVETVHRICELLSEGMNYKKIASVLGVSEYTVNNIKYRKAWQNKSEYYNF